ncbi:MAG: hypothetical protein QOF60_2234 [Actinomycetota bacterium]|jgi:hypothetical protein|nr:hypothetical protein [Actinomycetota bacterium]
MTDVDGGDDFDRLAAAVARVLREAFTTAEGLRQGGLADAVEMRAVLGDEAAAMRVALRSTADDAARTVTDVLAAAHEEARAIVAQAEAELSTVRGLVEAERSRVDAELSELVHNVRRSVASLRENVERERHTAMEEAANEAAMILRQARLHHRHSAKEAERMLAAASASATALRNAAFEDAARVAAQSSFPAPPAAAAEPANVTPMRRRPA